MEVSRNGTVTGERFDDLLRGSLVRRVLRHVHMHNPPAIVRQHHKAIQRLEGKAGHDEEVASRGRAHVVREEGAPGLRRPLHVPNDVLRDGRLGDLMSDERQLGLDPRSTPGGVIP